eukprot:NODE_3204_length_1011_cov_32.173077_g3059_i0.p1 GENE.NODE_3204_length_1011_cov_32.173077_g3059_i0~~NODE_3204_length_1011_cov_32.173077_g3059_i0.p1  ORF type:complete len:307 (-),score=89.75 NODE_3204_length_1011_cov_32.173077_g3059_i0:90-965(-)
MLGAAIVLSISLAVVAYLLQPAPAAGRTFLHQVRHAHHKANAGEPFQTVGVSRVPDLTSQELYFHLTESLPVVVTNSTCTTTPWDLHHIRALAGHNKVGIEVSTNNRFYANSGLNLQQMTVAQFLDIFNSTTRKYDYYLAEQSIHQTPALAAEVRSPPFADFLSIDRTQLWVGAGGQVSPLHHDHWENVLCQLQGTRTFLLFAPFQVEYLYPKPGPERYFSQLDPSNPDLRRFPLFAHARPVSVQLNAGELLVLPAFWWHQVHHHNTTNLAVNFWYYPNELASAAYHTFLT